jgi:hypothetical protein
MSVNQIALRVDKDPLEVVAWLESKKYGGFAVEENVLTGDNRHWHFLVIGQSINIRSFREMLKKAVTSLKGNGSYSAIQVRDLEKYERYMCKGTKLHDLPKVIWSNSLKYIPTVIERLHCDYWSENGKSTNVNELVYRQCKVENVAWDDRPSIVVIYLREMVKMNRPINEFAAKAAVNLIQCKLSPNEDMINELKYRI